MKKHFVRWLSLLGSLSFIDMDDSWLFLTENREIILGGNFGLANYILPSLCLTVCLSVSVCLSVCLCLCLSVCLSVSLSLSLSLPLFLSFFDTSCLFVLVVVMVVFNVCMSTVIPFGLLCFSLSQSYVFVLRRVYSACSTFVLCSIVAVWQVKALLGGFLIIFVQADFSQLITKRKYTDKRDSWYCFQASRLV